MATEKGPKEGTNSIYLDAETTRMARELMGRNYTSLSDLMREAVSLAYQAKDSPYKMASIHTYPPMNLDDEDYPYNLDKWIYLDSTERVFLMGTTMRNPIVNYSTFWNRFLEDGKSLYVLLQGDLGIENGKPMYAPIKNEAEKVSEKRAQSLQALAELSKTAPKGSLVVRKSDGFLISQSAIIVFGSKNSLGIQEADIQIQPSLEPQDYGSRSPQFLVRTQSTSAEFSLFVAPLLRLWERSATELRS